MGWLARIAALFCPADRALFHYWDGAKTRSIDPLVAWRAIWTHPECNLLDDIKVSLNPLTDDGQPFYPIKEVYQAEDRLAAMTREVFGVRPWSENVPGLTLQETSELLTRFNAFIIDLKKKLSTGRTTPPPSASRELPCSPATASGESPAGSELESPSMPSESTAAAPSGPSKQYAEL